MAHLYLSLSLGTSYGVIPYTAARILVQNVESSFINRDHLRKEAPTFVQRKKSVTITLLAFVLQLPAFLAPSELRSWNNQALQ
jgi:hypothetical protein